MSFSESQIKVQDIAHLGIVAGIIDEMSLVDLFNQLLGTHPQEIISAGQVVKATILNGLGFISAPLYFFEKFFSGIATEHLLAEGIQPEHLNDERLGRVLEDVLKVEVSYKSCKSPDHDTYHSNINSSLRSFR